MRLDRENKSRYVLRVTFEMSDWILSRISRWSFESTCALSVLTPLLFLSTLGYACALLLLALASVYVQEVRCYGGKSTRLRILNSKQEWILWFVYNSSNLSWTCSKSKEIGDSKNPFGYKTLLLFAGPHPFSCKIPFLKPSPNQPSWVDTSFSYIHWHMNLRSLPNRLCHC